MLSKAENVINYVEEEEESLSARFGGWHRGKCCSSVA
jgi:hypothetical protein